MFCFKLGQEFIPRFLTCTNIQHLSFGKILESSAKTRNLNFAMPPVSSFRHRKLQNKFDKRYLFKLPNCPNHKFFFSSTDFPMILALELPPGTGLVTQGIKERKKDFLFYYHSLPSFIMLIRCWN